MRAIPVWPGLAPWGQTAAQFSYHAQQPDGTFTHSAWLAEGPLDPRPAIAQMLVDETANEDRVVTYSGFEKSRIRDLQKAPGEIPG